MSYLNFMRLLFRASIVMGVLGAASTARGQAWVGEEHGLDVSLGYTFGHSTEIVESEGHSLPNRPVTYQTIHFGAEYTTPVPHLAVDIGMPLILTNFPCQKMIPNATNTCVGTPGGSSGGGHGPYDDGSVHFTPTDIRAGARYQVIGDPIALTFGLAGTLPTHSYPVQGFAAPGRDVKGLHFMGALGWIPSFLPALHAMGMYEFSLFEGYTAPVTGGDVVSGFNQNHSDIAIRVGYFIIQPLEVHLAADIRISHGGLDFVSYSTYPTVAQDFHDAILNESIYLVGGGASYQITDELAVDAIVRIFVGGKNTDNRNIFGGGLSWKVF